MQTFTLSNGKELTLVTSHRRKSKAPELKHDHTIVGTVHDGYVFLSYAFCHNKDSYCKKEGRSIAIDRLIHCLETEAYADQTLVGVIPVVDVIHYQTYDVLSRIGIDDHEDVMKIAESLFESMNKDQLKTRNMVTDAIDICEFTIGSAHILQMHRNAKAGL